MSYKAYERKDLGFTTRQLHAGYDPGEHYRSKAVPIYQTAAFELGDYERCNRLFEYREEGDSYVRFSNPTNRVLEKRLASLEGGTASLSLASGMAAISAQIFCRTFCRSTGSRHVLSTMRTTWSPIGSILTSTRKQYTSKHWAIRA